jgi:tetratricopeptide (TPR) repeat protein
MEVHGLFKAKEAYEAGMKAYGEMDYDRAIKYLKLALDRHDGYTKSYILAEANAMLGVIYQFHIIHLGTAYAYYKDALAVDPDTKTAKKHIREVYKYRNRKD